MNDMSDGASTADEGRSDLHSNGAGDQMDQSVTEATAKPQDGALWRR